MSARFRPASLCRILFSAILSIACFALTANADKVFVKGSDLPFEGKIIKENGSSLTIQLFKAGGVKIGIDRSRIERIEREAEPTDTPGPTETPVLLERGSLIRVAGPSTPTPAAIPTATSESSIASAEVPAASTASDASQIGIVGKVSGVVLIQGADGTWRPAKEGDPLRPGDRVHTREGKVGLIIKDPEKGWQEITLMEQSEAELPKSSTGEASLDLKKGEVWLRFRKYSEAGDIQFQIKAPNANAAVRGEALLSVRILADGVTDISLFEGQNVFVNSSSPTAPGQRVSPLQMAVFDRMGRFQGTAAVSEEDRKRFDEWDKVFSDLVSSSSYLGAGVGGAIIEGMTQQIEAEQALYESMMDEGNKLIIRNKEMEKLDVIVAAIKRFCVDVGYYPPEDQPLQRLVYNLGDPGWKGPYLDMSTQFPIKDRWGKEIRYTFAATPGGILYVQLISEGPNQRYDQGGADDIKVPAYPPPGMPRVRVRQQQEINETEWQ